MNKKYIKEAEKLTSFNIKSTDFTHLNYKKEIRHLVNKHWFPDMDCQGVYKQNITFSGINNSIKKLKKHNNESFNHLYSYNLKGTGPGEIMLYYLVDKATVGGGSSCGVDIEVDGNKYEIKAVNKIKNKKLDGIFVNNFKLSGTINLNEIMKGIQDLTDINKNEIAGSKINEIRHTSTFKDIENLYREEASYYFKHHDVIFLDNSKSENRGEIISLGKVNPENIFIERMTSGTVKPLIKISE